MRAPLAKANLLIELAVVKLDLSTDVSSANEVVLRRSTPELAYVNACFVNDSFAACRDLVEQAAVVGWFEVLLLLAFDTCGTDTVAHSDTDLSRRLNDV